MSLMKEMAFTLGGETYSFSEDVEKGLREIRELYTEAFRKGNEDSMDDFFAASFACVVALGEQRIRSAAEKVRNLCSGPLPVDSVQWGEDYLLNLLEKGR